MKLFGRNVTLGLLTSIMVCGYLSSGFARDKEPERAQVTVWAGRTGCLVDIDSEAVGKTNAQGNLLIPEVEPGDHYVHVDCPKGKESTHFISPHAGQSLRIQTFGKSTGASDQENITLKTAKARVELRKLVQQSQQLRAQGRIGESVECIREALKLDPENADLHRELGITFLLDKDWKRARVEMIEAIRHDRSDADAHNGLGYALEKLGNLDGAVAEYRMATRLEPDDPTYRTHYFDALAKLAGQEKKSR